MFKLICTKRGYSLWKNHKSGDSAIYNCNGKPVFKGTHYIVNQEFLKLISK